MYLSSRYSRSDPLQLQRCIRCNKEALIVQAPPFGTVSQLVKKLNTNAAQGPLDSILRRLPSYTDHLTVHEWLCCFHPEQTT